MSQAESLHSTYLPHWTFDTRTTTRYQGERGDHYYETQTSVEDGETRTEQMRRTRWYDVSGMVARVFDDVLVPGSTRVDPDHLDDLAPWPLGASSGYRPEVLVGYETLRYDVGPQDGLDQAKRIMAQVIENDCRADIGGDEQRVHRVQTEHDDLTAKLVLLPVWVACYLHNGRTFDVLVNGSTGKIAGERPYSTGKIVAVIAAVIALIGLIFALLYLRLDS